MNDLTQHPSIANSWKRAIPVVVVTAAFAHCLSYTWFKWGDIVVDSGRDMEVARQMLEGRKLYSEIRYAFGPLAPWVNSSLFQFFGVHADVAVAAGLATAVLMCLVLYRLARRFTDRGASTLIVVAFLYICAFGQYTASGPFNFVLPYTSSTTYGELAGLSSLFFLVRHVQKNKRRDFVFSVLFLILAALAKMEIAFAIGLAHAAFALTNILERRFSIRFHLPAYMATSVAVAAVFIAYSISAEKGGHSLWRDNLFALLSERNAYALAGLMGIRDLGASIQNLLYSALALSAIAGAGAGLNAWRTKSAPKPKTTLAICAIFAMLAAGLYAALSPAVTFCVLPLMAVCAVLNLSWRWYKAGENRPAILAYLLLWLFAGALLARMGLKAGAYHYGFFMLPPAMLALGVSWFSGPRSPASFMRWGGAGMFIGMICSHVLFSQNVYAMRTVVVDAPRGRMALFSNPGNPTGKLHAAAVNVLSQFAPETTALALPAGVGLVFFSGLRHPYGMYSFLAVEQTGTFDENYLLDHLKAEPPDLIVRALMSEEEWNVKGFGIDYATRSEAWIGANYEVLDAIGVKGQPPLVVVFKRIGVQLKPRIRGSVLH